MANLIKTKKYGAPEKQILIAEDSYKVTLGAIVAATGATEVNGRKILKAGTPVAGDFKARNTAFVKNTTAPNAIVLHDVDVTAGNENGTIVLFGFVDLDKLDAETFKLITAEVKTELSGKVTFLTGSGKKRTK